MKLYFSIVFIVLLLFISACAPVIKYSPESTREYKYEVDGVGGNIGFDPYEVKQAIPKVEPKSKYGNPPSYTVFGKRYYVLNSAKGYKQRGDASWYGKKFHGERTSSGETYNMYAMTAAHKSLPLPTYVRVTNLENQRSIIVKLNDRGPFHEGRIIDLSYSAANQLGIVAEGTGPVEVEAIDPIAWAATNSQQTHQDSPNTAQDSQYPVKDSRYPVKDSQQVAIDFPQSYIQVGAFREIKNAYALAAKLRVLFNFPVLISKKKAKNQWLSTVKIGPFSSPIIENSILNQIIEHGYYMARIVK